MTDEEAIDHALAMTPLQRKVIGHCSPGRSWGYRRIAEKSGLSYEEVKYVGHFLQEKKWAHVSPIRHGSEFAGSAIFLNERGEHIRIAAEIVERKTVDAPNN